MSSLKKNKPGITNASATTLIIESIVDAKASREYIKISIRLKRYKRGPVRVVGRRLVRKIMSTIYLLATITLITIFHLVSSLRY